MSTGAQERVETASGAAPGKRMHVLTLVDHLSTTGGAERLALDLAIHIDPSRFRSTLCATRFPGGAHRRQDELVGRERLREAGVPFIGMRRRGRADVLVWRQLLTFLRRERVDVVHAHMFGSNAWGTLLGRLARVPVIVAHEHTWSFRGEPIRRLVDRELIGRYCDVFLAVSREDRRKMIEIEHVPRERIRVLPNGISTRAASHGRDIRAELGLGTGPLLGAVGTLRAQKSYDILIEAALLLRPRHPDLRLLIVGDGPVRSQLEAIIAQREASETVRLLGRRDDVPDLLAALDIAVNASSYEGSPLAVMEFMAAGLPIVATRVGGVPDLIDDGVHGLLVEPGEPVALADAIGRLLSDPHRASALAENARARQRREFDFEVMVKNVEALYEELLSSSRAAAMLARRS